MVRILYCFSWLLFAYQVKTCECGEKLHAMDSGNKAFGTIRGRFILENGGFSEALRKELRIAPKGGVPEILFYLDPKVNVAIATPNEKHKLEKLTIKFWAIEEPFAFAVKGRDFIVVNKSEEMRTFVLPGQSVVIPAKVQNAFRIDAKPTRLPYMCNVGPVVGDKARTVPVIVTSNRCFTRSNRDGSFELRCVPPGDHVFYVYHPRGGIHIINSWKRGKKSLRVSAGKITDLGRLLVANSSLRSRRE